MKISEENCCVVCKATEVDFKYELEYGEVFYCKNCSAAYTNFNNLENFHKANDAWNVYDRLKSQIYNLPELRKEAEKRLNLLLKFSKGKKLIEFGPNTGEFLFVAHKNGFQIIAVDKCPAILNLNRFEELKFIKTDACDFMPNEKYDAVAAFHLLEHLEAPEIFLNKIYKYLNPDGVLFLEVPNYDSLSRKKQGKNWFMFYDYHISHFNLTSLSLLLNRCGFKVAHSRTVQPMNLLIDPFYLPFRHLLWKSVKFLLGKRGSSMKVENNSNHLSNLTLEDETKIANSIKSKVVHLEILIKKMLSIPFWTYARWLEKMNYADVIQVIAKPKDQHEC